ncbi:twin-arginine translocase subunit TatC [Halalkalibacterium ligniniphilum]|uniref:twin-arginine translocase subunit TatC n=2 Tax=Halalkalibacterium ligniniphilum TaxID=1134413 RepID=UPI000347A929|nr:twin-arginine translocase subunit TatC [Halalkalibacterium ligniniphilum]
MEKTLSMPVIDHLEELRKRIILSGASFVFFFLVSFIFVNDIYQFLIKDIEQKLTILSPGDVLWAYMSIAAISAVTFSLPVIGYQVWKYLSPALSPEERASTIIYIPFFLLLFLLGLSFGFFVLFPVVMDFLLAISSEQFETMFTVDRYFRFMFYMTVPLAFLFQLPAIILFLTRLGIINPNQLVKARKYAYFVLIVLSVLITPADFLSDLMVMIPLLMLYELSVTLSRFVYRKNKEK